ncbi:MAG: DUF262 domain-containing HNH endonuclease family protein [Gaiella sp.]|nr:DUF262 domain-containing HNH endonuclease family protein [Gaiella sp.]
MNGLHTLQSIFVGRRFEIPDYQRGYGWGEVQWTDLIDDLETLPAGKDHFTGMIVLKASAAPPAVDIEGTQYACFDVVDGQQRLTTLVVLLESIRRMLGELGKHELAEGIRRSYVRLVDRNGQPVYRVRLNDGSQPFLESVVLADHPAPLGPKTHSQLRLVQAREFFSRYITDRRDATDADTFVSWLHEFHDKIAHHLKLNLYVVEDAAEVGVIFEVMNNRGKPLSELDLVKNYVLYLGTKLELPEHSLHSDVVRAWGSIFRDLMSAGLTGSEHEDQLLRAHWLLAYDYQRKNWDRSRSIKARFSLKGYAERHPAMLDALKTYVSSLSHAAVAYCDIYRPTRPEAFADFLDDAAARLEVVRMSDALVRVNALAGFIPLLVATRLAHPGNARLYLEVVRLSEAFAFRLFRLHRWRSHTGQSTLFRLSYQLHSKDIDGEAMLGQLRSTLHAYDTEQDLEKRFAIADDEPSNWYGWPGIKYLLYEYERHLSGNDDVWISWAEVEKASREKSIEHILPQTPAGHWLQAFSDEERARLTHDLGNLSLTSDNSALGAKQFVAKKGAPGSPDACYANSPYAMERALAQFDDWTPESLLARRARIVDWALRRWGVAGDEAAGAVVAPDELDDDSDEIPIPEPEPLLIPEA